MSGVGGQLRLEGEHLEPIGERTGHEVRQRVVCYSDREAPTDPDDRAAYLDSLRPDDTSPVVFVALGDNGRGFSPPTPLARARQPE